MIWFHESLVNSCLLECPSCGQLREQREECHQQNRHTNRSGRAALVNPHGRRLAHVSSRRAFAPVPCSNKAEEGRKGGRAGGRYRETSGTSSQPSTTERIH